jgi:hypothetical protein
MSIFARKLLTILYICTTVCSLMCGPLAILGESNQHTLGMNEQRWLHIGHADDCSKIMFGQCIYGYQ